MYLVFEEKFLKVSADEPECRHKLVCTFCKLAEAEKFVTEQAKKTNKKMIILCFD